MRRNPNFPFGCTGNIRRMGGLRGRWIRKTVIGSKREENMMNVCVRGTSGAAAFFTGSDRKNMAADVRLFL